MDERPDFDPEVTPFPELEGLGLEGEDELAPMDPQEERIAELESEVERLRTEVLRGAADLQNFRRQAQSRLEDTRRMAAERVVNEFLPVMDNFERTLDALKQGASLESLQEGVTMIHRQFLTALNQSGVKRIEAVGKHFDPELHEAIEIWDSTEHEDGTVTDEISPGYAMNDRVIRAARVRVARRNG